MAKMFKRASKVCRSLLGAHTAALLASGAGLVQCKEPRQRVRQNLPLHPWLSCFTSASSFENENGHIYLTVKVKRKPCRRNGGANADWARLCRSLRSGCCLGLMAIWKRRRYYPVLSGRKERLSLVKAFAQGYTTVVWRSQDLTSSLRTDSSLPTTPFAYLSPDTERPRLRLYQDTISSVSTHPHDFMNPFHSYKEAEEQGPH